MGHRVVVVGAGIFGVTAAIAMRLRGSEVTLVDPGPIPHPLAESTDISKVVRMDYGADAAYTALMERALDRWRSWNATWPSPLFHETGVMFLTREPMSAGGFEHESFQLLTRRGHPLERMDAGTIRGRFPAWNADVFVDGYFNPAGGHAESGKIVAALVNEAKRVGARVLGEVAVARLVENGSKVGGVRTGDGETIAADVVVVAAGSWTPQLLPHLADQLRAVGQPVFHLLPRERSAFDAVRFPVFGADIARTGYYGFPVNPDGIVKIANHGVGRAMLPDSNARVVTDAETSELRAFLRVAFPSLADAAIASTRVCVYCDTFDEHFLIAPDPSREGLVIAAGGSGHGFKFAPVLGDIIADAALGNVIPKFRFRPGLPAAKGEEAARHRPPETA